VRHLQHVSYPSPPLFAKLKPFLGFGLRFITDYAVSSSAWATRPSIFSAHLSPTCTLPTCALCHVSNSVYCAYFVITTRECQRLLLCSPADPAPPTLLLQSVAIVIAVASFIVIFAAMINERNRVIQWTALCSSFFAAAAVFVLSAFALRFANQFRLKTVRCACFCRCAGFCCWCLVGMPPCARGGALQ
jgi:hypothetical protein